MFLSDPVTVPITGKYRPPSCTMRGEATAASFFPGEFALWSVVAILQPGAEIEWGPDHGDEVLHLTSGTLTVNDSRIDPESAIAIESGASVKIRALDAARIVHFGNTFPTAPSEGDLDTTNQRGGHIHTISALEAQRLRNGPSAPHPIFFLDGTCSSCRTALFLIDFMHASSPYRSPSHSHSADQIIHVLDGALQVGRHRVQAGMSIGIRGDARYAFRAEGPFRFLNYRPAASFYTGAPGSTPMLETASNFQQREAANG